MEDYEGDDQQTLPDQDQWEAALSSHNSSSQQAERASEMEDLFQTAAVAKAPFEFF
jgi:hypothetical protein